jgi:triacylglycerol esterase/lipase EstA (alpha/beta hydrolase family)
VLAAVVLATVPGTALGARPSDLYASPGVSPPGANDFSCKPSASHPDPVVLVHGTFLDQTESWLPLSPQLKQKGYCVFALDYGQRGSRPIEGSGRQLADFVDGVLEATGAQRVKLVGHSQGGMLGRYYVKFLGGEGKVDEIVGLAPSNHGTTTPLAPPVAKYGDCPACGQQVAGSAFMTQLNEGNQTPGDIDYTVVETKYDEVVTPYTSAFLPPGDRVTNVLLQDRCPADLSEHAALTDDPVALHWVLNALNRPGPADPGFAPNCIGSRP